MGNSRKNNLNCDSKKLFPFKYLALDELENYRKKILFSNMNIYYCEEHFGYHLGHKKRMSKERILKNYEAWT